MHLATMNLRLVQFLMIEYSLRALGYPFEISSLNLGLNHIDIRSEIRLNMIMSVDRNIVMPRMRV